MLVHDDDVITVNDYIHTIIPWESTIEDVAKLDPLVYEKISYVGNSIGSIHHTEDTGEIISIQYNDDKSFIVRGIYCPTLYPELYDH